MEFCPYCVMKSFSDGVRNTVLGAGIYNPGTAVRPPQLVTDGSSILEATRLLFCDDEAQKIEVYKCWTCQLLFFKTRY